MTPKKSKNFTAILFSLALSVPLVAQATVVEIRTVNGNFKVNLFDEMTPKTVDNFLSYVNAGAYANNVVHRAQPNFVMQAGGFAYSNEFPPAAIAKSAAVVNEPVLSNVRGTIAMAKLGGNPNSATSQWFINVGNNSANLDSQNGGFTVFGQVIEGGMEVVDEITTLPNFNFGSPFAELPLRDYTSTDKDAGTLPTDSNLIIITDVVVIDAAVVTNPSLNPVRNTSADSAEDSAKKGGGSLGGLLVALLAFVSFQRRSRKV